MRFDFRNLFADRLGGSGLTPEQLQKSFSEISSKREKFYGNLTQHSFTQLPENGAEIAKSFEILDAAVAKFADDSELKAVVVVGIGGSDLGARAVHQALNHRYYNQKLAQGNVTDVLAPQRVQA